MIIIITVYKSVLVCGAARVSGEEGLHTVHQSPASAVSSPGPAKAGASGRQARVLAGASGSGPGQDPRRLRHRQRHPDWCVRITELPLLGGGGEAGASGSGPGQVPRRLRHRQRHPDG